jgi:hypothetical protein
VELLGKNPIGKRENVIRGIKLGLFGGHDKNGEKTNYTLREN